MLLLLLLLNFACSPLRDAYQALSGLIQAACRKLELGPSDVFLQNAPVSFDASVQ